MASVARKTASVNSATSAKATVSRIANIQSATMRRHLSAAAWHALTVSAGKEAVRDDLLDGSAAVVNLTVTGEVDGHEIEPVKISAVMTVGHETERATSQTPEPNKLVAYLLGKMNPATRDAILRDLPGEFEKNEFAYPAVDSAVVEASDAMLKKIRACKRSTVRGSVSVKHQAVIVGNGGGLAIVGEPA